MKHQRLLAVLVAVVALLMAVGVGAAFSKAALAAPTVTSAPPLFTTSRAANLSFTGPAGATFKCGLDGAVLAPCTSPRAYTALADGTHVFSVASMKAGETSSTTTYRWTVDNVAPTRPTLWLVPAPLTNVTAAVFVFAGSEPGLRYTCSVDGSAFTPCVSVVGYSRLADGSHTFAVRAIDPAGNTSTTTSWVWRIDTVAPPAPVLTTKPSDPTPNTTNDFAWTVAEAGTTSQCSLENGAWFPCTSPYRWVIKDTNNGQHQFAVRSRDAAGNVSTTTKYTFKYQKGLPTSGVPFQITGSVSGLRIGVWQNIAVTVTNPNSVQIFVNALQVGLAANSSPAGCTTAQNLTLEQANVSTSHTLTVPAHGSVALPAQGVIAPRIQLRDLPTVNQDVCKGKSFTLTYSGSATN